MEIEFGSGKTGKAVLVSVQLPGVSDDENAGSLAELGRLVKTLGLEVVAHISQKRKAPTAATILGEGKLKELASWTGGKGFVEGFKKAGHSSDDDCEATEDVERATCPSDDKPHATMVVFDSELSPTQLKNLEEATGVEVLDRTGVILEIFSRHARSREARLQVEIAKLGYLAPRLRASSAGSDRQGGGIGAKGAGETSHELDKRRIRDRIAELRQQLEVIHGEQKNRRSLRREALSVAMVGYTNAGKSSLMRALTGSEVLVEDKLFATLDTTVRALQPQSVPRILISDTVGFIKKLPHDLVASFRSTLDEALSASLLLFTVDASDPTFRSQLEVTQSVLGDIGATSVPSRLILNKTDCLDEETIAKLKAEFPEAILISTRCPDDIVKVKKVIRDFFEKDMIDEVYSLPYAKGQQIGVIRERARVLHEDYDESGTQVTVRALPETHEWLRRTFDI